ncbi:MAG: hypothetical protein CVU99_02305 [Firmicutes bacterium HGW-Firmicutes-4]|jgi:hypothetical protein|nr:MAG: hypothetical protein CVU99_02305 [Firmicutes bacterium HGW-Firmicutes-4]
MIKTFYVQTEKDTNKVTDVIEYPYEDYIETLLETPLPPKILAGCYKLLAGSAVYVPDWDKDQKIVDLENQTAEYMVDLDFRLSNIELGL